MYQKILTSVLYCRAYSSAATTFAPCGSPMRGVFLSGIFMSACSTILRNCAVRKHSMLESECVQWKRVEPERMRVQICSESSFLCFHFTGALAAVVALWKWWASRACSRLRRVGLLAHIRYRWCHHSGSTLVGKSLTTHCLAGASSSDVRRREEVWRSGSPSAPT